MSKYEIKLDPKGPTIKVKSIKAARKLADGKPFIARKILRHGRGRTRWQKYYTEVREDGVAVLRREFIRFREAG